MRSAPHLLHILMPCHRLYSRSQTVSSNNENNNNDNNNSITSISLSVITLFRPFPFLLKLYLTSSTALHKQDYWYLSEMKVHFQRGLITRVENPVRSNKAETNSLEWLSAWSVSILFCAAAIARCPVLKPTGKERRQEAIGVICLSLP